MTFRWRTALVVLTMTLLSMGGAFAGVWHYFVTSQRDQLDAALLAVAQREAAEAALGQLSFSDAPGPTANAVGPLPKYGVIYGADGAAVVKTNFLTPPPLPTGKPLARCFDLEHEGTALRAVLVAVPSSPLRILLASPRNDIVDDSHSLAWAMTVAFLVGCVWAALLSFFAATRLTRNYRTVESVARRVAAGDTSARVRFGAVDGDLHQLADDLNSMIDRLVGLAAAQDRFVAHAAHELRTPLTSLRIELEHALKTAHEPGDYELAVRGALDSGLRLSSLADDLLVVARARSVTSDPHERCDLAASVAAAVREVEPLAGTRHVTLVTNVQTTFVRGNARSIGRIVRNVLENAIRFSPDGERVELESSVHDAYVEVRVVDHGVGVAPDDHERIFEPFERGVVDPDHPGAGLGLSIARGLARAAGGDVRVAADRGGAATGHGATFALRFARPELT